MDAIHLASYNAPAAGALQCPDIFNMDELPDDLSLGLQPLLPPPLLMMMLIKLEWSWFACRLITVLELL